MEIKFKEYKKIRGTEQDAVLEELLKLSKEWASEKCCPAYYKKEPIDFLNHDVYFAVDQDCIVGYALGHGIQLGTHKILQEKNTLENRYNFII